MVFNLIKLNFDENFEGGLLVGVFFGLFFGLPFLFFGGCKRGQRLKEQLSNEGAWAQGQILTMRARKMRRTGQGMSEVNDRVDSFLGLSDQGTFMFYEMDVQFVAVRLNGTSCTITGHASSVDESFYLKSHVGMSVAMRYLPHDVTTCAMADQLKSIDSQSQSGSESDSEEATSNMCGNVMFMIIPCFILTVVVFAILMSGVNIPGMLLTAVPIALLLMFCGYRFCGKCFTNSVFAVTSVAESGHRTRAVTSVEESDVTSDSSDE